MKKSIQEHIADVSNATRGFPATGSRLEMLCEMARRRSVQKNAMKLTPQWRERGGPVPLDFKHFGRRHD
jgi:hypothetical protein